MRHIDRTKSRLDGPFSVPSEAGPPRGKFRPHRLRFADLLLRFFAVGLPAACLFSAYPFLVARAGLSFFAAGLPVALFLFAIGAGDDLPQVLGASFLLLPPAFMWACRTYSLQTILLAAAGTAVLGSGLAQGIRLRLRRGENRHPAETFSTGAVDVAPTIHSPMQTACEHAFIVGGPTSRTSAPTQRNGEHAFTPPKDPKAPNPARTLSDEIAPGDPGMPGNAIGRALHAVCLCLAAALGVGGLPSCLSPDAPGAAAFLVPQALGAGLLLGAGMLRARKTAARRHASAQFAMHPKAHRFSGVARRRIPAQPAPHSNACHCSHATRQRSSTQLAAHPAASLCGGAALLGALLACLAAWGRLSVHFAGWSGLPLGILCGVFFGAACAPLHRAMCEEPPALRALCRLAMLLGGALPGLFRDTGHSFAAPVGAALFALLALGLCAPPDAGD